MKKQITIGVGDAADTAKEFIDAWKLAERGETVQEKHRLQFENLEMLLKTLTPGRWTSHWSQSALLCFRIASKSIRPGKSPLPFEKSRYGRRDPQTACGGCRLRGCG